MLNESFVQIYFGKHKQDENYMIFDVALCNSTKIVYNFS